MAKYKFEIKERLPGLNEYTKACRTNKYAGAKMKQEVETIIMYYLCGFKNRPIKKPVFITFTWIEENGKRDLDNICFAKKFILDALVKVNILEDDNKSHISGFKDTFKYSNESKVIVELEEL